MLISYFCCLGTLYDSYGFIIKNGLWDRGEFKFFIMMMTMEI